MTEQELREEYVRGLEGYLGAREGDARHRELIDLYNSMQTLPRGYRMTYSADWCVATAVAVAVKQGLTEIIFPECSCTRAIGLYEQAGRFRKDRNYRPRIGDFLIYDWQSDGDPDHWGAVAGVEGDVLTVIEGNLSDRVDRRTVTVGDKRIYGYCLPDYGKLAEEKRFLDVDPRAWYASAVDFCARQGWMQGTSETTFAPDRPVTRGELAAVLARVYDMK